MPISPLLMTAGLSTMLLAAVAGNSLGQSPVVTGSSTTALASEHPIARPASHAASEHGLLPDRYPLVTRQGVVPVERLSDRGLFSQARYRMDEIAMRQVAAERWGDAAPEQSPPDNAAPNASRGESNGVEPALASASGSVAADVSQSAPLAALALQ